VEVQVVLWVGTALADAAALPTFTQSGVVEVPLTRVSAELGGAWSSGNTEGYTLNAAIGGAHRWKRSQASLSLGANLGRAAVDTDGDGHIEQDERAAGMVETARHYTGEVRYDLFVSPGDSVYARSGALVDTFAGYDWRGSAGAGWSHSVVKSLDAVLVVELGGEYAREDYVDGVTPNAQDVVSLRALVGGWYTFNAAVKIEDRVEVFENVLQLDDVRVLNTISLTAGLTDRLAVRLSDALAYDHVPVEGYAPLDNTTLVTLVATWM
jgi:putative salt-induced outer membrane protein YdiY